MNYYNEHDKYAAAWLRELIKAGVIPDGVVDERDIQLVQPGDLDGFNQYHFFAGIGGWAEALRLAGVPSDYPIWTASCPCQPFSVGATYQAKGTGDHRDLRPSFFKLQSVCKPAIVVGEQIRNAISWGWWDRVKMDVEAIGYAAAAAVMRADAAGANHQRKRLCWVAYAGGQGREGHQPIQRIPVADNETLAEHGDPFAGATRALGGDYSGLLPCDGVSVQMERNALKCYGNAIVPPCAAKFIEAALEAINEGTP